MKSDTANYVHLQKLYRAQADKEKREFKEILEKKGWIVEDVTVDEFLKNVHGIRLLRGREFSMFDENPESLGLFLI